MFNQWGEWKRGDEKKTWHHPNTTSPHPQYFGRRIFTAEVFDCAPATLSDNKISKYVFLLSVSSLFYCEPWFTIHFDDCDSCIDVCFFTLFSLGGFQSLGNKIAEYAIATLKCSCWFFLVQIYYYFCAHPRTSNGDFFPWIRSPTWSIPVFTLFFDHCTPFGINSFFLFSAAKFSVWIMNPESTVGGSFARQRVPGLRWVSLAMGFSVSLALLRFHQVNCFWFDLAFVSGRSHIWNDFMIVQIKIR